MDVYVFTLIFPPFTLLDSELELSHQLGGDGKTKTVSKACLIESKKNGFYIAECLLGKMSVVFTFSFLSVSIILIFPF